MICITCKQEIRVHWVKPVGTESLDDAMDMEHKYKTDKDAEPWPEVECGCGAYNKPTISFQDYRRCNDSPFMEEFGSALKIEPQYMAYCCNIHRPDKETPIANIVPGSDKDDVIEQMVKRLFSEILIDSSQYIANTSRLYDVTGPMEVVLDINDPQESYTFGDWKYYVKNDTED